MTLGILWTALVLGVFPVSFALQATPRRILGGEFFGGESIELFLFLRVELAEFGITQRVVVRMGWAVAGSLRGLADIAVGVGKTPALRIAGRTIQRGLGAGRRKLFLRNTSAV